MERNMPPVLIYVMKAALSNQTGTTDDYIFVIDIIIRK